MFVPCAIKPGYGSLSIASSSFDITYRKRLKLFKLKETVSSICKLLQKMVFTTFLCGCGGKLCFLIKNE